VPVVPAGPVSGVPIRSIEPRIDKLDAASGEAYGFRKMTLTPIHRGVNDVLQKRSQDGTNLCGPRI